MNVTLDDVEKLGIFGLESAYLGASNKISSNMEISSELVLEVIESLVDTKEGIEQLKAQLAIPKPEWISVEDRLPEMVGRGDRSESVLIRRDFGPDSIPTTDISFRWSDAMIMHFNFNDEYSLVDCWDEQESRGYRVTHWMPLPETPTQEQDE